MNAETIKSEVAAAIREEADECLKSSKDFRNMGENRSIFYVLSISLNGIADKLDGKKPTFADDGNTFQSGPDIVNVK